MTEANSPSNGNGYARWRDIDQMRKEHEREIDRIEESVKTRFDRAHDFYSGAHGDLVTKVSSIDGRVDALESIIDQQRGAKALIYFLIGSNLLSVLAFGVTLWALLSHNGPVTV